jgi:hypothetical protein
MSRNRLSSAHDYRLRIAQRDGLDDRFAPIAAALSAGIEEAALHIDRACLLYPSLKGGAPLPLKTNERIRWQNELEQLNALRLLATEGIRQHGLSVVFARVSAGQIEPVGNHKSATEEAQALLCDAVDLLYRYFDWVSGVQFDPDGSVVEVFGDRHKGSEWPNIYKRARELHGRLREWDGAAMVLELRAASLRKAEGGSDFIGKTWPERVRLLLDVVERDRYQRLVSAVKKRSDDAKARQAFYDAYNDEDIATRCGGTWRNGDNVRKTPAFRDDVRPYFPSTKGGKR